MNAIETYEERRAREAREVREYHAKISNLADAITADASIAGYRACAENDHSIGDVNFSVYGIGGREIILSWGRYGTARTRVTVSGRYPRGLNNAWLVRSSDDVPEITISLERPTAAILKDIARRFLPAYETLFSIVLDRVASERAEHDKLLATGETIAKILGVTFDTEKHLRNGCASITVYDPYLTVESYGNKYSIKSLSDLTEEQVRAIIKIVRK